MSDALGDTEYKVQCGAFGKVDFLVGDEDPALVGGADCGEIFGDVSYGTGCRA